MASHLSAVEAARLAAQAHATALTQAHCKQTSATSYCWYSMTEDMEYSSEPCQIVVENLPEALCKNTPFIRAMLQQAHIVPLMTDFEIVREAGKFTGAVRLSLISQQAAWYCVQHFAGCNGWIGAKRGASVHASILSPSRAEAVEAAVPEAPSGSTTQDAFMTGDVEASGSDDVIDMELSKSNCMDDSDSEQSTTADAEFASQAFSDDDTKHGTGAGGSDRKHLWADMNDEEF